MALARANPEAVHAVPVLLGERAHPDAAAAAKAHSRTASAAVQPARMIKFNFASAGTNGVPFRPAAAEAGCRNFRLGECALAPGIIRVRRTDRRGGQRVVCVRACAYESACVPVSACASASVGVYRCSAFSVRYGSRLRSSRWRAALCDQNKAREQSAAAMNIAALSRIGYF